MEILNLNFMHPEYGTIFNADVDISFTADEMLNNLLLAGFLPEHAGGYQLALGEKFLSSDQPLSTLLQLEDASVLRIKAVASTDDNNELQGKISCWLQHPYNSSYAPVELHPDQSPEQLLQLLEEKGFLQELSDQLELYFQEELIARDQAFKNFSIPQGAYLELKDPEVQNSEEVLRHLLLGFDSLQSSTNKKLEAILKQMPAPSAIPIDPQRAINPTADNYESIDTLIGEICKTGSKDAPKKIRLWSPIPLLFWIFLLLTGISLFTLSLLNII